VQPAIGDEAVGSMFIHVSYDVLGGFCFLFSE
jgi:hypothetical protein